MNNKKPNSKINARPVSVEIIDPRLPRFALLEDLVIQGFFGAFQARVQLQFPQFLGLTSHDGTILAAAGLAFASDHALFLERYLDKPIEEEIQAAIGRTCARNEVVEIGNLISRVPFGMRDLFLSLEAFLRAKGAQWAAFTGTRTVRRGLLRSGFTIDDLGPAQSRRLGENTDHWGTYYDNDPRVTLIDRKAMLGRVSWSRPSSSRLASLRDQARCLARRTERESAA